MSRQLERNKERQENKLKSWVKGLSAEKIQVIDKMIVNSVDKKVWALNQAIDTSVAAALFELHDFSIKEVEEILKLSNNYIKDGEEFLRKYGEEWLMELKKVEPKIKKRIKELINKETVKSKGLVALKKEFKDIPAKDLSNFWIDVKEDMGIGKGRNAPKKFLKPVEVEMGMKEAVNARTIERIKVSREEKKVVIEDNKSIKEGVESMLKVISKEIRIEGEFGKYMVTDTGVSLGEELFGNLKEVEVYEKAEKEKFDRQIRELKEVFKYA